MTKNTAMLEPVVVGTLSAQQQFKPVLNNYTHVVAKPCIAVKGNNRVLMAVQALSKIYRQLKYCKILLRFVCMYMNLSTDIITLTELNKQRILGFYRLTCKQQELQFWSTIRKMHVKLSGKFKNWFSVSA